jgi:hypothetical protein
MKKTRLVGALLSVFILAISIPTSAFANFYAGGRSSAKFNAYYDSSVVTYGYEGIYDTARASWGGISSNVAIGKTTSLSGLPDKYYVGSSTDPKLLGLSSYYDANGNPVNNNVPRAFTTFASYNNNLIAYESPGSSAVRISNAIHELGHTLSLAHTTQSGITDSVMFQGIQTIGPQQYDKNQLKAKWGN